MLPTTVLFMAVAALAAPSPSTKGYDGVEGFTRVDLSQYGPKRASNSSDSSDSFNIAARDDNLPDGVWKDNDNYLYTSNGGPCDDGCFVTANVSPDMIKAWSVGSSGYGDGRTIPNDAYPGGDTIFSVEQALTDSWETSCKGGSCVGIGGVTKSYNTYRWPGACGRNVAATRLDSGFKPGTGLLQLRMTWAANEGRDEKDKGLYDVLGSYIENTFLKTIVISEQLDLRLPGFNNVGDCRYTDGKGTTNDGAPIQYQDIRRSLVATLLTKNNRHTIFTLKLLNGVCDPKPYPGICDGIDAAIGALDFLPGFVSGLSSILCGETEKPPGDIDAC